MILRFLILLALLFQFAGCTQDPNRKTEEDKIEHRHQDQMIRMG